MTFEFEDQLKSIEPSLRKRISEYSEDTVQYLRPISVNYILGEKGITLFVKYQIDSDKYYHVKVTPPSAKVTTSDFRILGVSGPKSNGDPLIVF